MTAVAASGTAMTAVAASGTAMAAVNASDTAMNAIYTSPLITKINYTSGQTWATLNTLRSGIGLFVRLTTKAGVAGWGEGAASYELVEYDGTTVYYSERNANPYNHTALSASPRLPMRRFASTLKIKQCQALEIAYIPLSA
jgi:hypothetical protein